VLHTLEEFRHAQWQIHAFRLARNPVGRAFNFPVCATPGHALEICVETLNDLINGLNATLTPQADGTVTLRLVAQTYAWNGAQLAVLGNRLNLLGGYAPGCASRTVNPANTVINGLGALDLEFFEQGLGVTVEGIRFSNVQFLRLNSAQQCFDYGNAVTWRRTIVDGTAGDFRIGSSCGPLIFQNNAVLQTLGTVLQLTPENLPIDAFVVNNTFFDSLGDGLRLFRGEDTAISTFRLGNNLIWSSTGIDLALSATGDLPLVTAFNNTFVSSNVPISDGADNTSLDPQLNANGVPAVLAPRPSTAAPTARRAACRRWTSSAIHASSAARRIAAPMNPTWWMQQSWW
jgi:hypothetical protein